MVRGRPHGRAALCGIASAVVAACAIFPDEAVLPTHERASAPGGTGSSGGSAPNAGSPASPLAGSPSTDPGRGGSDSSPGAAGEGGSLAGAAGKPAVAGAPGALDCGAPSVVALPAIADTWIEPAHKNREHGTEPQLFVVAGASEGADSERRALFSFALPSAPAGAMLTRAVLVLTLESNADVTLAQRRLSLFTLTHDFVEERASWTRFDRAAAGVWENAGGDFGAAHGGGTIAENLRPSTVALSALPLVRAAYAAELATISLIVGEVPPGPAAPAELTFTSREGEARSGPSLLLEYCAP